jgi:hypothetical protein
MMIYFGISNIFKIEDMQTIQCACLGGRERERERERERGNIK